MRRRGRGESRSFLLLVLQAASPVVAASLFVTPTADRRPLPWWSQFRWQVLALWLVCLLSIAA